MSVTILRLLIGLLVLFTCMPIHECAHAWVADKLGDSTAKNQGRVTLNPIVHLDPLGSILMVVSSILGFGFGWAKPVQINPNNFKNRKIGMGISALAGPVSNFLLALLIMIIMRVLFFLIPINNVRENVLFVLSYMILLNVGLAVFNFLPIPPLDGSRIMLLFLPEKIYFKLMRYEQIIFFILLVLMLTNILDPVLNFLQNAIISFLYLITNWVDLVMNLIMKAIG